MSTRQKSFFDQNHENKPRPQWHRNPSTGNGSRTNAAPAKDTMSGLPIAPSSHTRSKLKAFQFIEGRPSSNHEEEHAADKENAPYPNQDATAGDDKQFTTRLPVQVPTLISLKTFPPSTPATRIPLADLIGNAEDAARRAGMLTISPDEQIIWINAQSPSKSRTPVRRPRRRARSSSPVTSSQNEASYFFQANQDTSDLQNVDHITRTPQVDPAAELWNRYAINATAKDAMTAAKAPTFAHLIEDSSPHSSGIAGSVSGLRRWASCGLDWPTSKAKRRKTNSSQNRYAVPNMLDVSSDKATEDGKPKKSKAGLLVERIQETLARAAQDDIPGAPSGSSPLPETGPFSGAPQASPLQRLAPVREVAEEESQRSGSPETSETVADSDTAPEKARQGSSSDFGSDGDIDIEMLEAIECARGTATCVVQLQLEHDQLTAPTFDQGVAGLCESFDEFEEAGDLFAADLENLASLYDKRPDITPSKQPAPPSHVSGHDEPHEQEHAPDTTIVESHDQMVDLLSSEDEFGGDDIDVEQFAAAEAVATQTYQSGKPNITSSDGNTGSIQRYLITQVVEGSYTDVKNRRLSEKLLVVEDEKRKTIKTIVLRESWFDTPATPGSYVHLIGEFDSRGLCQIDNINNMLILHPDHLISATVVADSFGCIRRAVLQDRIKATSEASAPQLYGHILHELFQEAMKANQWGTEWLRQLIHSIIPRHFETIVEIGLNINQVVEHLSSKMCELQSWAKIFVRASPGADAVVKDRHGKQVTMSINKLLDVEEHIWSPMYGLKGNIDATVQVSMHDELGQRTLTVPFEVKTGKRANESHRAQTALYTLLLSDRYDVDVDYGILYYLETSEVGRIPAVRHELMHMVMQRNDLACYVRERLQLPPMLKHSHLCGKCYAQKSCFLYNKLAEDGTGGNIKAKDKFDGLVRSLKPHDQDFFKKWDHLLTKEESEMMKFRRELWTMLSTEREKLGRCFANIIIEPGSATEQEGGTKINRFRYTFTKHKSTAGFSFTESQITVGEPIVISDEKGHFALANGYVTGIGKRRVTVAVDRRLHNARTRRLSFNSQTNQVFAGIMQVARGGSSPPQTQAQRATEPVLYRLDKDEFSNGMATIRNNLIQVMDNEVFKARELRSLVIEGTAPNFKPTPTAYTVQTQSAQMAMNSDQEGAIERVMAAQDYALVLGMPGTGKTTTIAHIIRALVAKGKSVLLTSYTHTAVDNILLKIRHDNIGILRLGAVAKVHSEVQDFAILAAQPKQSLEELKSSWFEPPVVATTCLGINHPIFSQRTFDYCIVDEASQITLPVCLGPIRMAKTFVLVGDHFQLPPLVQNKEALGGGLDVSLFKLLSERHPQAVVSLEHQYRMCADVMLLSNQLIYDGRLKCGNDDVAGRELSIPNPGALRKHHYGQRDTAPVPKSICRFPASPNCWLSRVLDPATKVLFLNTDPLLPTSLETVSGPRILNPLEAILTTQLLDAFLTAGIAPDAIGVITFYRSQLALLRQRLRHRGPVATIEMHTADKFQGRDKEAVVVSCVRSNEAGNVGELLRDWRRVNVAVTRARSKLVLLGSKSTLKAGGDVLSGLVALCERNGWMLDLPSEALEMHWFEEAEGTQASARTPVRRGTGGQGESPGRGLGIVGLEESPVRSKRLGQTKGGVGVSLSPSPVGKRGLKVPEKVGRMGKKGVLGTRPVLRDIVNDAL